MTIGMPSIEIIFRQLAATAVKRSSRGVLALVVRDDTEDGVEISTYTTYLDIKDNAYSSANMKMIQQAFTGQPAKVIIVKQKTTGTTEELKTALDSISFDWLTMVTEKEEDQEAIVAYTQNRNKTRKGKKVKAIVYKVSTVDDIQIVRFSTETAMMDGAEVAGWQLLARVAGVLAGLPMTRSATYYELSDITSVTEPEDMDEAVDAGNLFLFNDEGVVKIARAVNSLKTVTTTYTEDMKSIAIVEAMNLIEADIYTTFKTNYLGKYKNSYDNQCLFIAAVNSYLKDLAKEEILDSNYQNLVTVDVASQREAWLATGKSKAAEWDDLTVKKNSFKRKVFLSGSVKILDAMEDLKFPITMM